MDVKNNEHLAQDVQNTELERLLSLLKSQAESNGLRRAVAQTIVGLGEIAIIPLLEAAKDTNPTVRVEALLALANLLRRIKHDKSNLSISTEIQVFEAFVEALKDVNSRVRAMAAREIIYHRPYDKRAVEPLITCLEDKNPRVRNIAIHNLGKIGDSRAVQALLNLITDKEKLDENVMDALSCTKDTRAVEPILEILLDKANSPKLRNSAAYALGNLGYTRVTQPLLSILSDTQDSARSAVAWALGQLREPQAIEPLIKMLKDKDK